MLSYISGTMQFLSDNYAVIDNNGLGYKVFMPLTQLTKLPASGTAVKVYTHLHVREDIFDLYGFITRDELSMFEMLLSVTGVGPKAALAVLSAMSPAAFALAVVTNDPKSITKAQGVGLKLAQRIILDLKDKLKNADIDTGVTSDDLFPTDAKGSESEAVSALVVLGYSPRDAQAAVKRASGEDVETIIKSALKLLMK